MKQYLVLILLSFTSCVTEEEAIEQELAQINSLSEDEINEGWELLFDGNSFEGWRGLGREHVQNEHWKIENGTIRKVKNDQIPLDSNGERPRGGDLMTIDTFDNYEFYFEWKLEKAGNSGVKYNVSETFSQEYGSQFSALGFEYQMIDNDEASDTNDSTHLTGSLYDMISPKNVDLKPIGEYNASRIVIDGNYVEHWLNGIIVVTYELESEALDSLYRKSKYKDFPLFQKKKKAHIILQNHSDNAWFRNIKIRLL